MKSIFVNALSVNNMSGVHVVSGHLAQSAEHLKNQCRFTVLCRTDSKLRARLKDRVDWMDAPALTKNWLLRSIWERFYLNRRIRETGANVYFTSSGMAAAFIHIPQVVLCQNPWALVPAAHRGASFFKAWLQRKAYRATMKKASVVAFLSAFMQEAYRRNAGFKEKKGVIAYPGLTEESRARAGKWVDHPRVPGQIVCVSAMAPHKNIETLICAFGMLHDRNTETLMDIKMLSAGQQGSISDFKNYSLHLVGAWPDAAYEKKIRNLVRDMQLGDRVLFAGHVSRERLDQYYAESQVYALISRCESFGIPAAESQLFGTPVVCSNVCAVPEIGGEGGLFCDPDDVEVIASWLKCLMNDHSMWAAYSDKALQNTERFRWEICSQPLVTAFKELLN